MNETRYRDVERRLWESVGATPSERTLQLDRTGATVRILEVGEGAPIVFVHGASNGATSWASLAARLDGFRCILIDRPGCGLSAPRASRFTELSELHAFADNLVVDVLDALDLGQSHVVGTSFGGYITLRSTAAHPDRITRLVELSWTVGAPLAKTPFAMRIGTIPPIGRAMTALPVPRFMVKSLLRQIGVRDALASGRFGEVEIDWFHSILRDTNTMRNEVTAGPRLVTMRGMNDSILFSRDLLGAIRTPTYFLWGANDPMGGEGIARAFVAQLPNAHLEMMSGAGHAPWMDNPDAVAAKVSEFLQSGQ